MSNPVLVVGCNEYIFLTITSVKEEDDNLMSVMAGCGKQTVHYAHGVDPKTGKVVSAKVEDVLIKKLS